ncbi:MAG: DUF6273 domain-containing protein [Oscillospiraceae bacterium]|jgi:hypothetical protein|nr:DUF6273 domain-containing protein [Oscillospiraceae bacterium]
MDENETIETGAGAIGEGKQTNLVKTIVIAAVAAVVVAAIVLLGIFVIKPMAAYGKAGSLEKKGEYALAFESFNRMGDYRDARARALALQGKLVTARAEQEDITLGGVAWQVLEVRDGKALVISKDALEERPYNDELVNVTWETSSLRKYLNETFINNRFSGEEQARIQTTKVKNGVNPENGSKNGKDTSDRIFLLSLEEANLYFTDNVARACRYNGSGAYWWLRSSGAAMDGLYTAAIVLDDGSLGYTGTAVNWGRRYVRPAMWISL